MGALEGLGGQILDTFVKSEAWGGGPGAEGTGVGEDYRRDSGSPGGVGGGNLDPQILRTEVLRP